MFLACAPYLMASMARAEGVHFRRGTAIAIGLVAGLGLAMKPHFLAIPIAAASRDVYRHFFRRLSEPESPLARAIAGHPAATSIPTDEAPSEA